MMRDYRKMQEELLPSMETQDWMWEEIKSKAVKREKKHSLKICVQMAASIAAAVLVMAALLPQTSVAEQIIGFMKEYFYVGTDMRQNIVQNVYEDTGKYGHVKMSIQQMLSDGASVYCNICYEALDVEGQEWLAEQEFDMDSIRFSGGLDEIGSWTGAFNEQEEQATERARYFTFFFAEDSGKFSLKDRSVQIFYPMYKSQGIGWIKIVSNLDTVSYRLVGDESPSKYYEPKYLIASRLSYGIFGNDNGIYEYWIDDYKMLCSDYSKAFKEEKKDDRGYVYYDGLPLSFTMKDGSRLDMGFAQPNFTEAKGIPGIDTKISAGWYNTDWWHYEKVMPIDDPNELAGVEIDGVHYDLVKEEIPVE